jgi:peptidyl-prolyl cis-trans isomerase SurA
LKKLEADKILPFSEELMKMPGIDKLKPLATLASQNITIKDFITFLDRFKREDLNNQPKTFLEVSYSNFIKETILKYELDNLEKKYPEYKELIEEYHQGMMLFEMTNEKIWNVSLKDTAKLEEYYEKIKFNYLDNTGNPKPYETIKATVLTEYQNELEKEWINGLKEKYPVWINEELFMSIMKNK